MLRKRRTVTSVAQAAALIFAIIAAAAVAAQAQQAATEFEKRCYSCHNIGGGDKKGPDLKGVTEKRAKDWLRAFIESPATVKKSGDPAAAELFQKYAPEVMPDQPLTSDQMGSILTFIEELSRKNEQFIPAGAKLSRAFTPADADAGRQIFTGRTKLVNGGGACISCHNISGIGALGGGSLGPDLTAARVKYREPELVSILQNPNFPVMNSTFSAHPLTEEEIVKVYAFLEASRLANPAARPNTATLDANFPIVAIVLLLCTLVATSVVWKDRLKGVRGEIIRRKR